MTSQKSPEEHWALLTTITVRHPSWTIVNKLILSLPPMKTPCLVLLIGPYLGLFCVQTALGWVNQGQYILQKEVTLLIVLSKQLCYPPGIRVLLTMMHSLASFRYAKCIQQLKPT